MSEQYILETYNLKKYFPAGNSSVLHAVDGINLRIEKGKTLGVVGESGCGKSTLGRTILRLTEPTSGQIYFNGQEITSLKQREMRALRSKMQIVFQDPFSSLSPRMTIEESIAEPLLINKMVKTKAELYVRVEHLMEMDWSCFQECTIVSTRNIGRTKAKGWYCQSLGNRILQFIVCDEPVSALDVSIQAQILNLLMDLQEDMGLSYLFITHDLSVVKHISHHIAVMYLGQCVEYAKTKELFSNPMHPYTQGLLEAIPTPTLDAREKEVQVMQGEIISPINPVPGCRFASRCPYATQECSQPQKQREVSKGHFVACCRAECFSKS